MRCLITLLVPAFLAMPCRAATHRVPRDFPAIAQALQAAKQGDTVRVAPGTYHEEVVLGRSVDLIGEDPRTCILTGAGDAVVTVTGRSRIARLTIRDGQTGVIVRGGASLEIEDCRIAGNSSDGIGFETDFNTSLIVRRCLITHNGDGIDLESTQGAILHTRFLDNHDDGLDYDGDAGVLVYGCTFAGNGDDGVEIRLARRTHALILNSRFQRNREDGIEVINSALEGGDYNLLCVQGCSFQANRRFGVGFVAHGVERHTGEMSKAAVYAAANAFADTGQAHVSPNYAPVFDAVGRYPASVTGLLERDDQRASRAVPVRIPLLVGIYNLRPTTDGTIASDAEGVAVSRNRVFVADDDAHRIHALDRRTGCVAYAIPTHPFPQSTLDAPGPEGLHVAGAAGSRVLLLADDDGRSLYSLSLEEATLGRVLQYRSTTAIGAVEGIARLGPDLLLAAGHDKIHRVDAQSLTPRIAPLRARFLGFGRHIAGIATDESGARVFATLSAYRKDQNWRNHRSGFFEMDPALRQVRAFWHLGPFSNDPRGIAASDGLVYVADGRSDFTDRRTREVNRGGQKVFVFLLEDDAETVEHVLALLPLRREVQK